MVICISHSVAETLALAEGWGRAARPGWVIGLIGDLGAGKTHFVKGLARGLGVADTIQSPTFALIHEYSSGRLPLVHMDLYRLNTVQQVYSAGLPELLRPDAITVIEWSERWFGGLVGQGQPADRLPAHFRQLRIETLSETGRQFSYEDFGG